MSCSRRLAGNVTSGPTFTCQWQQQGHITPASYFASLLGHFYLALFSALQQTFCSLVTCNLNQMTAALYNVFEWPPKRCTFSANRWWHGWLSLAGTATSIIFVATNMCLSQHDFFLCDKSMLAATKLLSQQNYVCHDKCSVQQKFCREKFLLRQKFCHDILLSQQKMCSVVVATCHDKTFVTTKLFSQRQLFVAVVCCTDTVYCFDKENAHLHADTLKKSTEEFHISVTF